MCLCRSVKGLPWARGEGTARVGVGCFSLSPLRIKGPESRWLVSLGQWHGRRPWCVCGWMAWTEAMVCMWVDGMDGGHGVCGGLLWRCGQDHPQAGICVDGGSHSGRYCMVPWTWSQLGISCVARGTEVPRLKGSQWLWPLDRGAGILIKTLWPPSLLFLASSLEAPTEMSPAPTLEVP